MKATGIIRRVDDLGRIIIPKDIRTNLGIKIGDPFEVFIDEEGGIIFKPYQKDEGQILAAAIEQLWNIGECDRSIELKKLLQDNGFITKPEY